MVICDLCSSNLDVKRVVIDILSTSSHPIKQLKNRDLCYECLKIVYRKIELALNPEYEPIDLDRDESGNLIL